MHMILAIHKKIACLTLLGLLIPLGNIWGPLLIRISKESQTYRFRRNVILFEICLTLASYIPAIVFALRGVSSGYNPTSFTISASILILQYIAIVISAIAIAIKPHEESH